MKTEKKNTFEVIEVILSAKNDSVRISVIYRPPSSSISELLKEFEKYAYSLTNLSGKLLIFGAFMDVLTDSNANKMKDLHSQHLKQHVS